MRDPGREAGKGEGGNVNGTWYGLLNGKLTTWKLGNDPQCYNDAVESGIFAGRILSRWL